MALVYLKKVSYSFLFNPQVWIYWMSLIFLYLINFSVIDTIIFALAFVLLFNFLPYLVIKDLESRFEVIKSLDEEVSEHHILVLGGGHIPDAEILFEQQLNNSSLRRVLEGVRIYNLNKNSFLIMSGESLKEGHPSQAEIQAKVACTMGVEKSKVFIIPEPKDTLEEAHFYLKKFGPHPYPIHLVTKAIHLRRAVFIFSSYGFNIIPAPAYYIYKNYQPSLSWFIIPDFSLIIHFGEYLKESIGYLVLRLGFIFKPKS
ncbi:MAG: YdcF family protein [Flavobacteriales bacterium]|nr:YdcF family protein [Flavobacteriales bacterium]